MPVRGASHTATRLLIAVAAVAAAATAAAPLGAQVVINELFYNEPGDAETREFVELWNPSPAPVSLDGWALGGGIGFTFAAGTRLDPGAFLVVAASPETLAAEHPDAPIAGAYTRRLANGGETVRLFDATGRVVDEVVYSDGEDWPPEADGDGASLELIDPALPRDFPGRWSAGVPPTPGAPNGAAGRAVGPTAWGVEVSPAAPTSNDRVLVSARVFAPEGLAAALLRVSIDGDTHEFEMRDDGVPPDEVAGDGVVSVEHPPLADRTFATARVVLVDAEGTEHVWPRGNDESDAWAWFVYDGSIETNSPVIWLFLSPEKVRILDQNAQVRSAADPRYRNFDQTFDAFVVLDGRVYRKVAVRHRGGFASRHAGRLKYSWRLEFPDWGRYQGRRALLIQGNQHWDDPFMRGDNGLQDKLCYMVFDRAGVPASRTRFVRLMVNNEFFGYHVEVEAINDDYLERNGFSTAGDLYKHGRTFQAHNFPIAASDYRLAYEKKNNDRDDVSSIRTFVEGLAAAMRGRSEESFRLEARVWRRDGGTRPETPTLVVEDAAGFDAEQRSLALYASNCLAEFDNVCLAGAGAAAEECDFATEADSLDGWVPVLGDWSVAGGVLRLDAPVSSSNHRLARDVPLDLASGAVRVSFDLRITSDKAQNSWAGVGLFLGDAPRYSFRGSLVTALRHVEGNAEGLYALDVGRRWLDQSAGFAWESGEWYRVEYHLSLERTENSVEAFLAANVDTERYRRYLAGVILATHWDSTSNNYYFYRNDLDGDRWVRFPIDMDITWGYSRRKTPPAQGHNLHPYDGTRFNPEPQEFMTSALREAFLSVESYRTALHDTLAEALVSWFTESELHPVVDRILETDGVEAQMDVEKWNTLDRSWSWRDFAYHAAFDKVYVTKRRRYLAEFLDRGPLLSQPAAEASADGSGGHWFRLNALGSRYDGRFDSGAGDLVDVRVHWRFDGQPEASAALERPAAAGAEEDFYETVIEAPAAAAQALYYRFSARDDDGRGAVLPDPERDGFAWYYRDLRDAPPAPGDVVINEVLYRAAHYDIEFVELANNLYRPVDISGWQLWSEEAEAAYTLPEGTTIAAAGYLVLSRDRRAVFEYYNIVDLAPSDLGFSLDNGADTLVLFDREAQEMDRLEYDDEAPWPPEPDGAGPSLERVDPRDPETGRPTAWRASAAQGTPGRANSVAMRRAPPSPPAIEAVRFHRGDVNADQALTLADPVALLAHLFLGDAAPGCLDAADADDDETLTVADAIALLAFLYTGGAPPAVPGPPGSACAGDPSDDGPLGCAAYGPCEG